MTSDDALRHWFCTEVLPFERALTSFIRRNWRIHDDVVDLRQDIYEQVLRGAQQALPHDAQHYLFTVARNHLINRAKRAKIVSFDLVADLDEIAPAPDLFAAERRLVARDELRRAQAGLALLPRRCREAVSLRKIDGLSTRETAERMGVGIHTIERQLTIGMRALVDFMIGDTGKVRREPAMRPSRRRGSR